MNLGITTRVDAPFGNAVERTRAALKDNGFGVLTEIDMQATLKAKIGVDMEQYLILGACNPRLAHRAVGVDRQIGLLLPCNVVVRADGDGVIVEAMNPEIMSAVTEEPDLEPVVVEATRLLKAAIDSIA
ncbi:DUF302 domain-containing protein [Rhodococcus sp. NPDC058521]|uniref:DUF302 domain-containing protein n=1 Tax=Rhodococcus sp. NPDC058521 TaxID=3346536 RepID=UPI00364E2F1B